MGESIKFKSKILLRQFKDGDFQKRCVKQMNINNFKNFSLAGKSNDQSGSEENNIRQRTLNVNLERKESNNSVSVSNIQRKVIPPPPKLRKKSSIGNVCLNANLTDVITKSKSITSPEDVKQSEQTLDSSSTSNMPLDGGRNSENKVAKTKPLPPPPPLLPMPMTTAVKLPSAVGNQIPTVEPKIIKKGDTVIKSYVDEKTGKIAVYEPGIKLEVCHSDSGKWYPAKVIQVDLKDAEVLIHYEKWSSRFDEWIKMDSNRLRPNANTNVVKVEFKVGEKVEAIWNTDGQRYPGVIIQVFPQDYYEVQFDDGIKCKKKSNQIFKIKRVRGRPPLESSIPLPTKIEDVAVNVQPSNLSNKDHADSCKNVKPESKDVNPLTSLPSIVTPTKSTPPIHFSIFTPPSGDLGKRKRTIQDYSALLKRPSKSLSNESEETHAIDDATVTNARKKKRYSVEANVSKVTIDSNSFTEVGPQIENELKPNLTSSSSKPAIESIVNVSSKVSDSSDLPAKRIRKPSRRFSTLSDEQVSLYSSEIKKFKPKALKKVNTSPVSSNVEKDGIIDDGTAELSTPKVLAPAKDENLNGICKDTSPISSTCTSPTPIESTDESLSFSDAPEDEKSPSGTPEGPTLTKSGRGRRRGRIQFRTKIPSDLANLDIPPPPASGYRLKKLYLEIEKVNDVNIEQVVSDPEGIIFKLNDPVPEGWRKEAQLKFRNETYPKWFISYVSPAGDRFRYLKQMHKLIQEVNFDFSPFDFRPLNPRLQEIAKLVSGGQYSYKRRTNMPPPPLLSELETSPGVGVVSIQPKPTRRLSVAVISQSKLSSPPPTPCLDSKIDSGFVDAEGNDVTIEQGEDGGWACPAQGCDKHFRKDSLLQMHLKHYHPEMKIKSRGGVKIANVVEMAKARTAFDYEPNPNTPKVLPSLSESDNIIASPGGAGPVLTALCNSPSAEILVANKRMNGKKISVDDFHEDQKSCENSLVTPSTEISTENVDIKLEVVDVDIVENDSKNDEEQIMIDETFTDAVEISAGDYKKPRINLRRKLINKRLMYRLPIRNSVKLESLKKTKTTEEVNPTKVSTGNDSTNSEKLQSMSEVQIIVEKCDGSLPSLATKVSSYAPQSVSNVTSKTSTINLRRPRFPKRNNSLLKSILKRQLKATSLQVQRARNFVQSRRGRGRPAVPKHVQYFSGLSRKQVHRIRQYMVENNIPIRFQGEPTVKDVKVEIINCICRGTDEFGLMVQCELCHCWQHGNCFGYYEDEDLPKFYVCESCRNPGNVSRTKFWEWQIPGYYKTGELPSFPGGPQSNFVREGVRAKCNDVKKWITNTVDCIENCNLKLRIAQRKPDHSKLYQWEYPSENPMRQKQIRDFRKTYKPWLFRRARALQSEDENFNKNIRKAYLKHLHWKKFQMLVEDFKWGIRSLDPKFLIILNKLSTYQRWKVRNTMEETRRLNLPDKETQHTNPFAIWARKHRQRQQWEIKMRKHANVLEKEVNIEELLLTSEMLLASTPPKTTEKCASENKSNDELKSGNSNAAREGRANAAKPVEDLISFTFYDRNTSKGTKVYSTREFHFSFCSKCRTSAGKRWDWSEFANNNDDFFGKNWVSKKTTNLTSNDEQKNQPYQPKTLKTICEKFISDIKVEKRRISCTAAEDNIILNESLNDSSFKDNLDATKEESKYLSDEFNCSDTTESIDCEDSVNHDKDGSVNVEEEECIRCYLISLSLSKDFSYPNYGSGLSGLCNRYQIELEKFSAVSYRDILTFLNFSDATRQAIWDSIENSLPYIPITPRKYPLVRKKERKSVQKIIRHYTIELKRYWTRMFNIRLRGVDLMMQKQTWTDELVRIYSEIHLILEDMRKIVDDSAQVDKLGDVLLRKIDIFRSICGTPDYSPLENFNSHAEISCKLNSSKGFTFESVHDDKRLYREATHFPNTSAKENLSEPVNVNKSAKKIQLDNIEKGKIVESEHDMAIEEVVESCISRIETETPAPAANLEESKADNTTESGKIELDAGVPDISQNFTADICPATEELERKSAASLPPSSLLDKTKSNEAVPETKCMRIHSCTTKALKKSSAANGTGSDFQSVVETVCSESVNELDTCPVTSDLDTLSMELQDSILDSLPSLPDVNMLDVEVDSNLKLFSDSDYIEEPLKESQVKRTIFPKIRAPFKKKLTAESCRDNLLQNILRQQELIEAHLDKLEEKVCELERKYTKRKINPMSNKKFVRAVQSMVFYNKRLTFLKRNAAMVCGGNGPSNQRVEVESLFVGIKQELTSSFEDFNSRVDEQGYDEETNQVRFNNRRSPYHLSRSKVGFSEKETRVNKADEMINSPRNNSVANLLLTNTSHETENISVVSSPKSEAESFSRTANTYMAIVDTKVDNFKTIISKNSITESDCINDEAEEQDDDQNDPDYTEDDEEESLDN